MILCSDTHDFAHHLHSGHYQSRVSVAHAQPSIGHQSTPRTSVIRTFATTPKSHTDLTSSSASSSSNPLSSLPLDSTESSFSAISSFGSFRHHPDELNWDIPPIAGEDVFGLTVRLEADGTAHAILPPEVSCSRFHSHHDIAHARGNLGTLDFDSDAESAMGYDHAIEYEEEIEIELSPLTSTVSGLGGYGTLDYEDQVTALMSMEVPIHTVTETTGLTAEEPTAMEREKVNHNRATGGASEPLSPLSSYDVPIHFGSPSHPTPQVSEAGYHDLTISLNSLNSDRSRLKPRSRQGTTIATTASHSPNSDIGVEISVGSTPHPASKRGSSSRVRRLREQTRSSPISTSDETLPSPETSRAVVTRSRTVSGQVLPSISVSTASGRPVPVSLPSSPQTDGALRPAALMHEDVVRTPGRMITPEITDRIVPNTMASDSPAGADFHWGRDDLEEIDAVEDDASLASWNHSGVPAVLHDHQAHSLRPGESGVYAGIALGDGQYSQNRSRSRSGSWASDEVNTRDPDDPFGFLRVEKQLRGEPAL